jgi:hypothetical protein
VRRKHVLLGYSNGNAHLQSWGGHIYDLANGDDLGYNLWSRPLLYNRWYDADDFLFGVQQSNHGFED